MRTTWHLPAADGANSLYLPCLTGNGGGDGFARDCPLSQRISPHCFPDSTEHPFRLSGHWAFSLLFRACGSRYFATDETTCQTASNGDPGSACKRDPPQALGEACPG